MFSEEPITPERPDPPLETPDLSLVSAEQLVDELGDRFPDGCLIHLWGVEDGNQAFRLRRVRGLRHDVRTMIRFESRDLRRACGE